MASLANSELIGAVSPASTSAAMDRGPGTMDHDPCFVLEALKSIHLIHKLGVLLNLHEHPTHQQGGEAR
jgi:hypothetical protein